MHRPTAREGGTVAVAASGGRDSTALLHATVHGAASLGLRVVALHVHHGLNPQADSWLAHVREQCRRWARAGLPVSFQASRLRGQPEPGQSIEAWARAERYAALAEMAHRAGADCVLLAHHRRDQAETVMLQALRGAGPAGLAAMPASAARGGLHWLRPWLAQPSSAIDDYVRRWRLSHIEDDSNQDTRFARNRLRHTVWPALMASFPDAEQTLVHAARHAALAAQLVDEIAAHDLRQVCSVAGEGREAMWEAGSVGVPMALPSWFALSAARRVGVLRAWLRQWLVNGVPDSLLVRLMDELPTTQSGRWPLADGLELRAYRGELRCIAAAATAQSAPPPAASLVLDLRQPGRHAAPDWGGALEVVPVEQGGVPLGLLHDATLRSRGGGEDFQRTPRSTARSLKKQYQAAAVPAWSRDGPLVWHGERLLFVPGLGLDARVLARPGEPQCSLRWWPDRAT